MSGLFNMRDRYIDYAKDNAWSEADAPVGFVEGTKAQFDLSSREEQLGSSAKNYRKNIEKRAAIIGSLGGDQKLAEWFALNSGQEMMQELRKSEAAGKLQENSYWKGFMDDRDRAAYIHVRKFETLHPDQVKNDADMHREMVAEFAKKRTVENDLINRAPWYASFAGAMGAAMTDPFVLMTLPLGGSLGGPGTSALKTAGKFAAAEGSIAGATEIPIQFAVARYKKEIESPWSFQQGALNVLAASAGGAILGGIMGGAGQAGRNALANTPGGAAKELGRQINPHTILNATAAMRTKMANGTLVLSRAEKEALNTLEAGARVDAMNPFTDARFKAVDADPFETYHNALEVAQRQHDAGQPVDVEDIVGDYLDFYHGSGAEFEEFDLAYMGSGEGAQAFGWGGYLAEVEGTAGSYRPKGFIDLNAKGRIALKEMQEEFISDWKNPDFQDGQYWFEILEEMAESKGLDFDDVLDDPKLSAKLIDKYLKENPNFEDYELKILKKNSEAFDVQSKWYLDKIDELLLDDDNLQKNAGHLYKTRILKRHVDNMLDWDKPLQEQPSNIQKAFKKLSKNTGGDGSLLSDSLQPFEKTTGSGLYAAAVSDFTSLGRNYSDAQKLVSELLNEYGIPGIKFLDGNSRGAGEGTRNIVFFDPRIVEITERNGVPIQKALDADTAQPKAEAPKAGEIENKIKLFRDSESGPRRFDQAIDHVKTANKDKTKEGRESSDFLKWVFENGDPDFIDEIHYDFGSSGDSHYIDIIFDDKWSDAKWKGFKYKTQTVNKDETFVLRFSNHGRLSRKFTKPDVNLYPQSGQTIEDAKKIFNSFKAEYLEHKAKISGKAEPKINYFDKRMNKPQYLGELQRMSDDLTKGGDISYIKDEFGTITGRTKSTNPKWFQSMVQDEGFDGVTVEYTKKAVKKAMAGEKLGAKQARVVDNMLGTIEDMRAEIAYDLKAGRAAKAASKEAGGIDEPPRSIIKETATNTEEPNLSSRTGIVTDDEYFGVLDEFDSWVNENPDNAKVLVNQDNDFVVRNAADVVEEFDALEKSLNDVRVCSLGGKA